jgi:D-alanyl-D-alanine carboxypeptidase/D-alanyl-D-alanine-endopeptidase (penicillin-binding protein 4)
MKCGPFSGTTLVNRFASFALAGVGTSYQSDPLGEGLPGGYDPDPRYNPDSVDCVTFVEQILVQALVDSGAFSLAMLDHIRYSGGEVGFEWRNHFFVADWIPANSWLVEDVTTDFGMGNARQLVRTVGKERFKGFHPDAPGEFEDLPDYTTWIISAADVPGLAGQWREPLIVVLIGNVEWLFATHVGIFLPGEEGEAARLVHAGSGAGEVIAEPFLEYLEQRGEAVTGIKLLRVLP